MKFEPRAVMTDFNGKPVDLGDDVIFIPPKQRFLCLGKVLGRTNKRIVIEYYRNWDIGTTDLPIRCVYLTIPFNVVKQ